MIRRNSQSLGENFYKKSISTNRADSVIISIYDMHEKAPVQCLQKRIAEIVQKGNLIS